MKNQQLYDFHHTISKWQPEEQKIIKELHEDEGIKNWVEISQILGQRTGNYLHSSRQCRERYLNFIKFDLRRGQLLKWTQQQLQKLFRLYLEYSSKWSKIAKQFNNKSENSLKNKFYGSIRKLIRQLNKKGKQAKILKKALKEDIIIRTLDFSRNNIFKMSRKDGQTDLNSKILLALQFGLEDNDEQRIFELIEDIKTFSSSFSVNNKPKVKNSASKSESSKISENEKSENHFDDFMEACLDLDQEQPEAYLRYQASNLEYELKDFKLYEIDHCEQMEELWKNIFDQVSPIIL